MVHPQRVAMHLTGLDIFVIAAFFAINLGIGIYFARRTKDVGEFFVSGGKAPWWLTGTSMVATTFAVDTPLAVTGFVAANGIAGNWLWWNMAASGLLTVFFFAALWRRSGVLTDVEFIELRYGGAPATWLRGVRAVYQGVIVNTIIMGWVNLAMVKVLSLTLHVPTLPALYICLVLTALYVTIGGLWSVLVTDMLQFIVKMSMAIVLAIAAVVAVGGITVLKAKLDVLDLAHHASGGGSLLSFFPTGDASWMPLTTFLVFVGVAWWASSYPGAEPGGGSYIAQRIFASKDEKNAVLATLFFNVAHYALRPWPWIVVALCALVLYPHGVVGQDGKVDPELGYVQTLVDYLPPSLRGLMLAGFAAAYMSTIGTQLNLGASYLTNDLYRRFVRKDANEHHYVAVSRVMTGVCLVLAAAITPLMHSVGDAWKYMLTMTAGVGLVMILRWYWWRINAWSEISALAISAVAGSALYVFNVIPGDDPNATAKRLLITVAVTTIGWIAVTLATQPETEDTLIRFFERVRPDDFGWKRIARIAAPASARRVARTRACRLDRRPRTRVRHPLRDRRFRAGGTVARRRFRDPRTPLRRVHRAQFERTGRSHRSRGRTRPRARDTAAHRARRRRQGAHQREGRRVVRTLRHAALDRAEGETTARGRRLRGNANRFARASRAARLVDRHARIRDARTVGLLQPNRYRECEVRRLSRENALRSGASQRRQSELHVRDADDPNRRAGNRRRHLG